jgi:hypothetical protein
MSVNLIKTHMAAKLQFHFAGVDLHRPSSPHRRWLRNGLIVTGVLLLTFGYWEYLYHLSHKRIKVAPAAPVVAQKVSPVAPTAPVTATPVVPVIETPVAKETVSAPAAAVVAAEQPVAKPVTRPYQVVATPVHRVYREHTDAEKMRIAADTAFGNVLAAANKYPDAYGFYSEDFLSDAKLGAAIPVFTISETDRANYKTGQPVKPLLQPANQWVYPVQMGERLCYMILVKKTGKEYVASSGSKALAMAWSKIQDKWSTDAGYHPQIVVSAAVPGYYFTVPELAQPNITDIIQMTFINPTTSPADVILASWR